MEQTCAICQLSISAEDEIKTCEDCRSKFHLECWNENGGCATYGCKNAPSMKKSESDESKKKSYWGAKTKTCPLCGEIIDIYTEECPYCNETFESIEPMSAKEFKEKLTERPGYDVRNKGAIKIFIFGLLGITAPFNLIFAWKWYKENKERVKENSPIHYLLAVIGLTVSVIYTFLIFLGIFFF